jgi:ligand-binding SRPBCC domain-containing protein
MDVSNVYTDTTTTGPGGVRVFRRQQRLPLSLKETFAFFARPENLADITPPWLGFRLLTRAPITMAAGLTLDYRVRVFGVPRPWRSLIKEYDPPHGFRDVQVIGPYRLWDHRHRFRPERSGTLIEDFVVYEPPLGRLGAWLDRLVIRRQLREIFDYRQQRTKALLVKNGNSARRL